VAPVLVTAVMLATCAAPAVARDSLPPDNSGLDQYVESLPGPEGDHVPSRRGGSLPASVRRQLAGTPDGHVLRRLAVVPVAVSGAPPRRGGRDQRRGAPASGGKHIREEGAKGLLSVLADVAFSSAGGAAAGLGLLVLVAAAAGSGLLRRRRGPRPPGAG
jgi:hypothetical protein